MPFAMQKVNTHRNENDTRPHDRRPVGRRQVDRDGDGEAAKDKDEGGVKEGEHVDREAEAAEAPAGRRKFLALEAAEQDAADGDHVGGEEAEEGERDDDVEGEGRTEIDEAEDASEDRGQVDGVEGDVELPVHLHIFPGSV